MHQLPDATPEHLDAVLAFLDMTNAELAILAGVDQRTVTRWFAGQSRIPDAVIRMVELFAMSTLMTYDGRPVVTWQPKEGFD